MTAHETRRDGWLLTVGCWGPRPVGALETTSLALVEFATDALMECPATSGARLTFEGDVAALRIRSRRLRIDLTPTCYLLHEDALTPEGWCSNYWADHHHNAADALDAVHYWAERVHHDLAGNCL